MKKFLKKRLLGVPVIALLIVALTAGAVMAAYPVLTGTVSVEVKEAFTVQYKSDDLGVGTWTDDAPANFNIDVRGAYPGECVGIDVRVSNASGSPLLATVSIVPRSTGWLDLDAPSVLFGTGLMVPANDSVERSFTACVEDDAAPDTYTIDITVSRG